MGRQWEEQTERNKREIEEKQMKNGKRRKE